MASRIAAQTAAARPARSARRSAAGAPRAELVLAPLLPGTPARSPQLARASSAEYELRLAPLVSTSPAAAAPRWAAPRTTAPPLQRRRSSSSSLITRSASHGAAELSLQPLVSGVAPQQPRPQRQPSTRELRLASLVGEAPAAAPAPAAPRRRLQPQRQRSGGAPRALTVHDCGAAGVPARGERGYSWMHEVAAMACLG